MLRITNLPQQDNRAEVRVEGRVTGADVGLLDHEIRARLEDAEHLTLDLSGLKYIDRGGLEMLRRWSAERLELSGYSPFLRSLLDTCGLFSRDG